MSKYRLQYTSVTYLTRKCNFTNDPLRMIDITYIDRESQLLTNQSVRKKWRREQVSRLSERSDQYSLL